MGIDGFMLMIGGAIILAIGIGFYFFIQYMKKNRTQVNDTISNSTQKVKTKFSEVRDYVDKNL